MSEPCYIPSKMLIHCADVMQTDQNATAFGIHAKLESIDRQFIVQPAFEKVYADAAMIKRGYRQSENVEVLKGHGRFTGPKILAAEGFDEELTAETILIAAGTLPWLPDIPSLDQSPYLTFDEALGLPEQPKRLSGIAAAISRLNRPISSAHLAPKSISFTAEARCAAKRTTMLPAGSPRSINAAST